VQKQKFSRFPRWGYAGLTGAVIVLLLMVSPVSAITDVSSVISVQLQIGQTGTGTPVSQASVYLDGTLAGTTDDYGSLTIPGVVVKTHTLKFSKSGYQDYTTSFTPTCNPGSCPSPEAHVFNVMVPVQPTPAQVGTTPATSPDANVQSGVTPQAYRTQAASTPANGFQNGVTPQAYRTQGGSVTPGGVAGQQTTAGTLAITPVIALVLIAGIAVIRRGRNSR